MSVTVIQPALTSAAIIAALGYTPADTATAVWADGDASTPGGRFASDLTTGVFQEVPGDSTLSVTTGGTKVATFDADGLTVLGFTVDVPGSGTVTMGYPVRADGNHNELFFISAGSAPNTVGAQNTDPTSISAFIWRDSDDYERGAIGFGNLEGGAPYAGATFWEASTWQYLTLTGTFNGTTTVSSVTNASNVIVGTTLTGTLTSGSATIASIADTTGTKIGDLLSGTNITAGTYVLDFTATTITMSAAASGSGTNDFVVGGMVLVGTNIPSYALAADKTADTITMSVAASGSGTNSFTANPLPPPQKLISSGWNQTAGGYQATTWLTRQPSQETWFYAGNNNVTTKLLTSGQWQYANGSAAAPLFSFLSDPDTGVYRFGANSVGIAGGGKIALEIDGPGSSSFYWHFSANNQPILSVEGTAGNASAQIRGYNQAGVDLTSDKGVGYIARFLSGTNPANYINVQNANSGANPSIAPSSGSNLIMGGVSLATNATTGFMFVPGCDGPPTGTPANWSNGSHPIVIDYANNKLYFYSTGAWRDAGP